MADIKDRAREYIAKHSEHSEVFGQTFVAVDTLTAMIEFAEQETKELKEQIAELSKHIVELQNDKGELTDKVKELEAQIEEMKQCGNCGNGTIGNCEHCKRKPKQKSTDTDDYWRLKEIKEK